MYECVIVKLYPAADEILDAEGDLDGESDVLDIDINDFRGRGDSGSQQSVTSSTHVEVGSLMDESE